MTDDARWFFGVDWASQAHQACLTDAGGKIIGEQAFAHGGAGLAELCTWLLAKTAAAPPVAIEVPHGPIVETLLGRGYRSERALGCYRSRRSDLVRYSVLLMPGTSQGCDGSPMLVLSTMP